jgi:hypothetical protein
MVNPGWLDPTDPDEDEISSVISSSGMQPYQPAIFYREPDGGVEEEGRRRRPPDRRRQKWVGPYFVELEGRRDNCTIKLSLYNFGRGEIHLKATWSGYDKTSCDRQFERIVGVAQSAILGRS